MSQQPFFDHASSSVRFWVQIDAHWVAASIRKEVLHYYYRPDAQGEDPMETYRSHRDDIEAAVRQRIAQGAREPVMVRETDLPPP
ncbi:DUF1488 family protein [Bordetella genomosp. 11]|uniref:DUF1488 domain-containing protein n=1 Tax=Bordetella genomosp. 11 TaxID=1416808 RepID=A0A261UM15_9BORD|nr:DUF1488 family protein [Bordetella genomosp. 11]OZI62705.1 hypothetical protein CAL28_26550 [Bordetella genomosp. 11]